MRFSLTYGGTPGAITGTLTAEDGTAFDIPEHKDSKTLCRTANGLAKEHKAAVTPEATHSETVTVSGRASFTA